MRKQIDSKLGASTLLASKILMKIICFMHLFTKNEVLSSHKFATNCLGVGSIAYRFEVSVGNL